MTELSSCDRDWMVPETLNYLLSSPFENGCANTAIKPQEWFRFWSAMEICDFLCLTKSPAEYYHISLIILHCFLPVGQSTMVHLTVFDDFQYLFSSGSFSQMNRTQPHTGRSVACLKKLSSEGYAWLRYFSIYCRNLDFDCDLSTSTLIKCI